MINSNILPYLKKNTSTLFVLSTAIALLVISSSVLPLSNPLLQPAQASTTIRPVRTQGPVDGTLSCGGGANPIDAKLTFSAEGTSIDNEWWTIYNGTFQLTNSSDGQILYEHSGNFGTGGHISVDNRGIASIAAEYGIDGGKFLCGDNGIVIYASTSCNYESENMSVVRGTGGNSIGNFTNGVIECGAYGDRDTTTAQPSSSSSSPVTGTITTQDRDTSNRDGDGDGILESSDRCTHNSNPRCFKEDTTTQQQQPSSNGTRNQTR